MLYASRLRNKIDLFANDCKDKVQSFANFLFIVVNMVLRSDDSRYIVISATVLTIYPVLATALRFCFNMAVADNKVQKNIIREWSHWFLKQNSP